MALTPTQTAALTQELQQDSLGLGYAARIASGDDGGLAALLNAPRAGQTCQSGSLTSQQILAAVTLTDLGAAGVVDIAFLAWLDRIEQTAVGFDLNNAKVAAVFQRFFASTSNSYVALAALRTVTGCSRAQNLFGVACVLGVMDIAAALGR
jgi:hypothetical protein